MDCNYLEDINYIFKGCYDIHYIHEKSYPKPREVKSLSFSQRSYDLVEIKLQKVNLENNEFIQSDLDMYPLKTKIICNDIKVLVSQKNS